jgi:Glycosyl hydrolase catalytic core
VVRGFLARLGRRGSAAGKVAVAVAVVVVIVAGLAAVRLALPSGNRAGSPAAGAARASASSPQPPRKGVGAWTFKGVDEALARSTATWYYTWSTNHDGITTPPGVGFVPMVWGAASVTSAALAEARAAGGYLLGFNEPDASTQSNMTVEQALDLWPSLMATGLTLGSPAVATEAATPGGWLDRFMTGAAARGYRVDFIAVHWYGADFTTDTAVDQLHAYLSAVYQRYHLPIWLTEYALVDFPGGWRYPGAEQEAAFLAAADPMLAGLPYVQRYAWFSLPVWASAPTAGLYADGPVVTPAGRAFEAASG